MIEDWYRTVEITMTIGDFERLPRNSAYKYEYSRGRAILSPRPSTRKAILDLRIVPSEAPGRGPATSEKPARSAKSRYRVEPVQDPIWEHLPGLMAGAFHNLPPFSSLGEDEVMEAAKDCLEHTRSGGDGRLMEAACFAGVDDSGWPHPGGAILITLLPYREWTHGRPLTPPSRRSDSAGASAPGASDGGGGEPGMGVPHLTWILVSPWCAGRGLGSRLLAESKRVLASLGYTELISTILMGNDASMAWHWHNGFRLLPNPYSLRNLEEEASG